MASCAVNVSAWHFGKMHLVDMDCMGHRMTKATAVEAASIATTRSCETTATTKKQMASKEVAAKDRAHSPPEQHAAHGNHCAISYPPTRAKVEPCAAVVPQASND